MLKELGLLILAMIVFPIRGLWGLVYTAWKHIKARDYKFSKQFKPLIRAISLGLDGISNALAGEYMNDKYLNNKTKTLKYGRRNETISSTTGHNAVSNNLTDRGKKFEKIIDTVLGEDHCIRAYSKTLLDNKNNGDLGS